MVCMYSSVNDYPVPAFMQKLGMLLYNYECLGVFIYKYFYRIMYILN